MTALFVVVVIHFIKHANPVPVQCVEPTNCAEALPTNGAIVGECETGDACSMGYYFPNYGVCIPKTMPNGTSCVDVCYNEDANTTCNDRGVCTGAASDCRGFCTIDSDCNASIPLNPYWLSESGNWDSVTPILWNYLYDCVGGRCELFTLDLYWAQEVDNYGEPISAYLRCKDFLNTTWAEERTQCLFQEDFLLDRNLTDAYFPDETPPRPSQFRMCTFHYKCAPFDLDLFYYKRALDEDEPHARRRIATAKKLLSAAMPQQKKWTRHH
jgi:hypothetical protein